MISLFELMVSCMFTLFRSFIGIIVPLCHVNFIETHKTVNKRYYISMILTFHFWPFIIYIWYKWEKWHFDTIEIEIMIWTKYEFIFICNSFIILLQNIIFNKPKITNTCESTTNKNPFQVMFLRNGHLNISVDD